MSTRFLPETRTANKKAKANDNQSASEPYVEVLGIAQDGGMPQLGCQCERCVCARQEGRRALVASIAIHDEDRVWLLDASPDIGIQMGGSIPAGIFLTHAHVGHYVGLLQLGKEALCTSELPVYCSVSMQAFLQANEPFASLSRENRIKFRIITPGETIRLSDRIAVKVVAVPHRSEFSDTLGFVVNEKVLYIPDADHWDWKELDGLLETVSHAIVDGTFYNADELPGRNMKDIPHPLVSASLLRFRKVAEKIVFIHFNHSNRCLDKDFSLPVPFRIANEGDRFSI